MAPAVITTDTYYNIKYPLYLAVPATPILLFFIIKYRKEF